MTTDTTCSKCRAKRQMMHERRSVLLSGKPCVEGHCAVCGTWMLHVIHDAPREAPTLPRPEPMPRIVPVR